MARPLCSKIVGTLPEILDFIPKTKKKHDTVILKPEEFESLRICHNGICNMKEGSKLMGVSAPTFYRLKASAINKLTDALINGKAIKIENTCN